MIEWLSQPVTLPLWGLLVSLILPVAYFAKLARELLERKLGAKNNE